ncbi:hypothetical protein [Vallicoccus soli]|uniref:Uncharacterized protein n=1 Tax=Vallicoccus soli TaxID=2339232 RepID=A0A3A3YPZ8_9ACTN|nr:hypothetical protein [Vallicoccus soli]RJK92783.1 hypothetical protein D5H78_18180 [Vallicoccus soli]
MADRDPVLAGLAAAQLAAGLAGLVVSWRRRLPYDVGAGRLEVGRGDPRHVVRGSLLVGSALAAPVPVLAVQAALTAAVAVDGRGRRALGLLALSLVPGYLEERRARQRLAPGGADRVESPLVAAGLVLAAAVAARALR